MISVWGLCAMLVMLRDMIEEHKSCLSSAPLHITSDAKVQI